MSSFDDSPWGDPKFSSEYLERADLYVVERRRLFSIVQEHVRFFFPEKEGFSFLDLGCGDGIASEKVLQVKPRSRAVLVDGSADMLERARVRLGERDGVVFVVKSFENLLNEGIPGGPFDLALSSLAIHHLDDRGKEGLFRTVFDSLLPGGWFLNVDLVRGESPLLEEWQMEMWRLWVEERKAALGVEEDIFGEILRRYKGTEENRPGTLSFQLEALKRVGFAHVDSFYRYGPFVVFGGRKE